MKTILIADDNKTFRESLVELLQDLETKVIEAENGTIALSIFKRKRIDLILSDIEMPSKTGIQLLKEVRKFDALLPFVLMTGHHFYQRSHLQNMGATDILFRPLTCDIRQFVDRILRDSSKNLNIKFLA